MNDVIISTDDKQPILTTCPPLIPDRLGKKSTFLESVLVAQDKLKKRLTVAEFLEEMLFWAGRQGSKSDRYLQNVLHAYYLVGLIPYTELAQSRAQQLLSTFTEARDLQGVRYFCLDCMTQRLDKMPQFWSVALSLRAFDTSRLSSSLGVSFEDAKRRIRLLRNLGALQKVGFEHGLSPLGDVYASYVSPGISYGTDMPEMILKEADDDSDSSFGYFIEW